MKKGLQTKTRRCKKCKVPLEGVGYKLSRFFFGTKPSTKKAGLCNKCERKK